MKKLTLCLLLIALLSQQLIAAPVSVHLTTSDYISQNVENSKQALFLGILSHLALDYTINQHTFNYFDSQSIKDNADYVMLDAVSSLVVIYDIYNEEDEKMRKRRIWGAFGGMLPDLYDAALIALQGSDRWRKGDQGFPFHGNSTTRRLSKKESMGVILGFQLSRKW